MEKLEKLNSVRRYLNRKLRWYHRACRFVAALLSLALLPLLALLGVVVVLDFLVREGRLRSPLWTEPRLDRDRFFPIFKFAVTGADGSLTPSGRFLRRFYLDELPQILNIAMGHMVFVGPRPHPVPDYQQVKAAGWRSKLLLPAGLTGGVQAAKGSDRHGDLRLDEDYLHFCLNNRVPAIIGRDLETIWRTCLTVARAEGL